MARLLEATDQGLYALDAQGRCVFVNRAGADLLGYAPEDLRGRNLHTLVHHTRPDGSPYPIEHCPIYRPLRTGEAVHGAEETLWRRHGEPILVECSSAPVIEGGRVTGAVVVFRDIGAQKAAEARVQEAEARYRGLFESTADAILVADSGAQYLDANPAAEALLGYTRAELLGLRVPDIVAAESAWTEDEYARFLREGTWRGELAVRRKDGAVVPVEAHATVVALRAGTVYVSALRDISARKQAEAELRVRAAQQEAVGALGQRALAGLELQALLEEAVRVVAGTLGVEYAKVLELRPAGDALLLRAGVGWQEGLVGQATVGAGANSQAGYTLLSDQPVVVEDLRTEPRFSGPPLLHEHGVISGVSVIIHGRERPYGVLGAHTRERRAFSEHDIHFLQAVANVLGASVERAGAEAALAQAIRDKDAFLATLSHDLKNPLAALVGRLQLLQRRAERQGEPALAPFAEGLRDARRTAARMAAMLDELVDLSRLGAETSLELQREAVDLVALAQELAADYQQATDRHTLRVASATASLVGEWDHARLARVLGNVLTNALKYSPQGGEVAVTVAREGGWAVVSIQDQGIGIPPEDLPHIFERYYRARNVASLPVGTGLGLAGASRIVEQHGGTVSVESTEGQGTTVTVRLPLESGRA